MHANVDRHALRIVEACYRIADTAEVWLAGVLDAVAPVLDRGAGLQAHTFTLASARPIVADSPVVETSGTPDGFATAMLDTQTRMPARHVPCLFSRLPGIATASETSRVRRLEDEGDYRPFESMRRYGIRAMLRAHILCGLEMQRTLFRAADLDAIIDESGRMVHAGCIARSVASRDALRRHALAIDRAQSLARRDPGAAPAAWRGLTDGTWRVIDTFDADGRRYYVARRNRAEPLTCREQQVLALAALGRSNKQIAYALGIAPSTVSTHLQTAMRRLGVRDVAALSPVFAAGSEDA